MNSFYISNIEIFLLVLLTLILILPFRILDKNNGLTFAHPLTFYSLIMLYYTVITPIYQIIFNQTSSRGIEFRDQYSLGWAGALLSAVSVLIGYSLKVKVKKKVSVCSDLNYQSLWSIGLTLNIIGLLLFMIFGGFNLSLLNPFSDKSLSVDFLTYRGEFKNYFLNAQEFLIPGNILMFASTFSTRKNINITFLSILISILIFLNSGFRYRILFLFTSILFFIFTKINFKRNLIKISLLGIILIVFLLTYIGQIRTYGLGFNIQSLNISNNPFVDVFNQAETEIFITTSAVMNAAPEIIPFQNFYPIYKTLIHPIPSSFFNKDSGDYLFSTLYAVYGFKGIYQGTAYLNYAEYYLMFGWFGIFIFNFLLGLIFKRLWIWLNSHKEEPLAVLVFILNVSFIFMIISRGYLPQQFHLYLFTVAPLNVIYYSTCKKISYFKQVK